MGFYRLQNRFWKPVSVPVKNTTLKIIHISQYRNWPFLFLYLFIYFNLFPNGYNSAQGLYREKRFSERLYRADLFSECHYRDQPLPRLVVTARNCSANAFTANDLYRENIYSENIYREWPLPRKHLQRKHSLQKTFTAKTFTAKKITKNDHYRENIYSKK